MAATPTVMKVKAMAERLSKTFLSRSAKGARILILTRVRLSLYLILINAGVYWKRRRMKPGSGWLVSISSVFSFS